MAVASLVVVGLLSGIFDQGRYLDEDGMLKDIAMDLCYLADMLRRSGSECRMIWGVPILPTGETVSLTVQGGRVKVACNGLEGVAEPDDRLRTWKPGPEGLNETSLAELDSCGPSIEVVSGQAVLLETFFVMVSDEPRVMVFASVAD